MNAPFIDKDLAKKYAQAFMAIFSKVIVLSDLKKIEVAQKFLQTHKRTLFFLQLPQFDQERRQSMVADLVDYFSLPTTFADIILLLIKHNRSFYIPEVLSWILTLYKEQIGIVEFSVKTAINIDEMQMGTMEQFLERMIGKKIKGALSLDSSLIAGVRLQSDNYLWEYSVRKQIRSVQTLKR